MAICAVAGGPNSQPQHVLIAIDSNFPDGLHVPTGFALLPEFLSGTAPIVSDPRFQRLVQSFTIHPGKHNDLPGHDIGDDGRYQPVVAKMRPEFCGRFEIMRVALGSQVSAQLRRAADKRQKTGLLGGIITKNTRELGRHGCRPVFVNASDRHA